MVFSLIVSARKREGHRGFKKKTPEQILYQFANEVEVPFCGCSCKRNILFKKFFGNESFVCLIGHGATYFLYAIHRND